MKKKKWRVHVWTGSGKSPYRVMYKIFSKNRDEFFSKGTHKVDGKIKLNRHEIYKIGWVVIVHTFNASNREAEAGTSLSL